MRWLWGPHLHMQANRLDVKQVGQRPLSTSPSFQSCFCLRVPRRVNKVFFFFPWLLKVFTFCASVKVWILVRIKKATRVKVKALIQLQYSSAKWLMAINETKHLLAILQKWKQPWLWGTKIICLLNAIQFYISSNNSTLVRLSLRR